MPEGDDHRRIMAKYGDPVFSHFCPWNQNLAKVRARGWGGGAGTDSIR